MSNPLVLLHGYSASGQAFSTWKDALLAAGRKIEEIAVGNYVTLNNEVTVDDIANGFQHALHDKGLDKTPFDAIVHSTGMLVLRSWLTASNTQNPAPGIAQTPRGSRPRYLRISTGRQGAKPAGQNLYGPQTVWPGLPGFRKPGS